MRCAAASILKLTSSLKPIGVVKIASSSSGSLRTTRASAKVATASFCQYCAARSTQIAAGAGKAQSKS